MDGGSPLGVGVGGREALIDVPMKERASPRLGRPTGRASPRIPAPDARIRAPDGVHPERPPVGVDEGAGLGEADGLRLLGGDPPREREGEQDEERGPPAHSHSMVPGGFAVMS